MGGQFPGSRTVRIPRRRDDYPIRKKHRKTQKRSPRRIEPGSALGASGTTTATASRIARRKHPGRKAIGSTGFGLNLRSDPEFNTEFNTEFDIELDSELDSDSRPDSNADPNHDPTRMRIGPGIARNSIRPEIDIRATGRGPRGGPAPGHADPRLVDDCLTNSHNARVALHASPVVKGYTYARATYMCAMHLLSVVNSHEIHGFHRQGTPLVVPCPCFFELTVT